MIIEMTTTRRRFHIPWAWSVPYVLFLFPGPARMRTPRQNLAWMNKHPLAPWKNKQDWFMDPRRGNFVQVLSNLPSVTWKSGVLHA